MKIPSMQQLLEAGVHFGHQTKRWNPKMAPFIFGKKKGIHVFDLEITQNKLTSASKFLSDVVVSGKPIIFVCTKKQVRDLVREGAIEAGVMHVTTRWLGGMLTNFATLQKSLTKYAQIKDGLENNAFSHLTKRERGLLQRKKLRLDRIYSGIANLKELPGVLVVVDAKRERTAIREANAVNVPVVAILDSNCDPNGIDYPIPANDDAYRAVKIIVDVLLSAVSKKSAKVEVSEDPIKEPEISVEAVSPSLSVSDLDLLNLSPRGLGALLKAGINSVADLKKLSQEELSQIKGLGQKTIDEITNKIKN